MQLFEIGRLVVTKGIADRMDEDATFEYLVHKAFQMHASGNWGDLCDEDWESNQNALKNGGRLFSAYWLDDAHTEKIWIITEWDRSVTTILFPDEY